jgi:hypothetical protein
MGLEEKRKVNELQEKILPERVKEIEEICGAPIPYEVDWESFDSFEALNFLDNLSCHRLNMALRTICVDEMGKKAVRDAIKVIKLKHDKNNPCSVSLENGVLLMINDYEQRIYSSDRDIYSHLMYKL